MARLIASLRQKKGTSTDGSVAGCPFSRFPEVAASGRCLRPTEPAKRFRLMGITVNKASAVPPV